MSERVGRVPPNSEEAERGVLGCILLEPERVLDLCADHQLDAGAFYIPWHRSLYDFVSEMHRESRAIDLLTVTDRARTVGRLDQVGGESYIEKLIEQTPTAAHAEYYIGLVQEKAMLRNIIDQARTVIDSCFDGELQAEEIRSKAEFDLALLQAKKTDRKTARDFIDEALTGWELARQRGCAGTPTGFNFLDKYFGGLMDCGFYIFSGNPGCGKTTLSRNICENIGMRGIPSAILSLEQTGSHIWGAVAARHAKQSVFQLNSGNALADIEEVRAAGKVVETWPIHVEDKPHTLQMIHSWARRSVAKLGARLLVIDYIQRISPGRKYENDTAMIGDYSRTLANICKELRVPLIAISSLSRAGNLRGSGDLDYDAWAWINMDKATDWNPKNLRYVVSFPKQRFGPPAYDEHLMLIGNEQRFEEEE